MSKQVQNQEEEIDLGGFFNQIGKLFLKLFNFLINLIKGLYHFFILTLIFCKKHYIKLGLAILVGIALGFIYEKSTSNTYKYDMILSPNYDGAYQLDKRVQYYNQLIANKNYNQISSLFKIDLDDSKSIIHFEMKRLEDLQDLYEGYDQFIQGKDSITVSKIPFDKYSRRGFSFYNSKKYVLRMVLNKNNLKKNIQKEIISDLENNKHLQEQQTEMLFRLEEKEKNIRKILSDIDTIRNNDKIIAITAAQNGNLKPSDIELNKESKSENKDISLLWTFKSTYEDLNYVLSDKEKYKSIYRVVTPFEPLGKLKTQFIDSKIFKTTLATLMLMILFILSKPIFKFLDDYKKN